MSGTCGTRGGKRNAYTVLVGIPEGKRPLRITTRIIVKWHLNKWDTTANDHYIQYLIPRYYIYIDWGDKKTPVKHKCNSFHIRTVHLDIIKVFYLPTDAQEN